jgi:hypothetical protein
MERWRVAALWPTYNGEKGRTLGKTYRIKARCYWEHPRGTDWEPVENLKGTCWEQREKFYKKKKKKKKKRQAGRWTGNGKHTESIKPGIIMQVVFATGNMASESDKQNMSGFDS